MIAAPPYLKDKRYVVKDPGENKTAASEGAGIREHERGGPWRVGLRRCSW